MNEVEYKDFIGYYNNLYPAGYCQHLINEFNRLQEAGAGYNRQQSENTKRHFKDDYAININLRNHHLNKFKDEDSCDLFFNGLQACYDDYTSKYSVLAESGHIRASTMKMQRTGVGGGYHVWHCEQGPDTRANRALVYMVYLNSLDDGEGGETEFLYQQTRIKPKENLMLLWPASYTHSHRGNTVLVDKYKYIVTGWFYYD